MAGWLASLPTTELPTMQLAIAAAAGGLAWWLCRAAKRHVSRPILHIETGQQRRVLYPIKYGVSDSAKTVLEAKDLSVRRELLSIPDGRQFFCQVLQPKEVAVSHILVFLHGYTSHTDLYVEFCAHFARQGTAVILFDAPGHGRSDGLLAYCQDWWAYVEDYWNVLDVLVPQVRASSAKELPVFGCGVSMGGGVLTCLALQRPEYFRGIVPIAPMLLVADDVKPHPVIVSLLKHIVAPLLPLWPITPSKDLAELDFRHPEQGQKYTFANPMSLQSCKPRLGTAVQLAFVWPDWVKSRLSQVRTPLFVLHGTSDKITDPAMSQLFYEQACASDKKILLIPDAYHCELFCCLPGHASLVGLEAWPAEQRAVTTQVQDSVSKWMMERT